MGINQLNVFEKLYLRLRARYDVKHELFQESEAISFDNNTRTQKLQEKRSAADPRPGDQPADEMNEPAAKGEFCLLVSPFINTELGKFEALREHVLGRHLVLSKVVTDRCKKCLVLAPFSEVLGNIDQQVDVLSSKIDLLFVEYEEQVQQWQSRRDTYEDRNEPHMVQMCINRILNLRGEYYSKTSSIYSCVVHLLGEKVKLINAAEAMLNEYRGRIFLRVRYYYQQAVILADSLPADYLRDEVLMGIGNVELLLSFDNARSDAQEKLKQFHDEIAALLN